MRAVGQRDTAPEIFVRKTLNKLGYRFRLHRKDLPGTPDIVLPKYHTCIFVNGCFWHHHQDCVRATLPKTNAEFWKKKISRNVERDSEILGHLNELGWKVLIIWECETKDEKAIARKIQAVFTQ